MLTEGVAPRNKQMHRGSWVPMGEFQGYVDDDVRRSQLADIQDQRTEVAIARQDNWRRQVKKAYNTVKAIKGGHVEWNDVHIQYPDPVVTLKHMRQKTALAVVVDSEMAQMCIRTGKVVEVRFDLTYF